MRSTFYTENTSRKSKDRVATVDKCNIIYEIDCSKCKAVYFGESKPSVTLNSDEHKVSVKSCNSERNKIGKHVGK